MKPWLLIPVVALCLVPDLLGQQRFSFDLDVPSARFSVWRIDDIGASNRLDGTFEVLELRRDRTWYPAFQFRLEGEGKGLSLSFVQEGWKGPLPARIEVFESGKRKAEIRVDGRSNVANGLTFHLTGAPRMSS